MPLKLVKQFFKKTLSTKHVLKVSKGNRFIFCFHDVSAPHEYHYSEHYSTSINNFKKQMQLLNKLFDIVPLDTIVSDETLNKRKNYAAITFDDGFLSVLTNANPILKEMNIPYTVFLNGAALKYNQIWVSNIVLHKNDYHNKLLKLAKVESIENEDLVSTIANKGSFSSELINNYKIENAGKKIYLNEEDVKKLSIEGVQFGNHTYDHIRLSSCENIVLENQISENKELIETLINEPASHFAIPFGRKEHYDKKSLEKLRLAKHEYIYTTNPNKFRTDDLKNKDFLFPRIAITEEPEAQILLYINLAILRNYNL